MTGRLGGGIAGRRSRTIGRAAQPANTASMSTAQVIASVPAAIPGRCNTQPPIGSTVTKVIKRTIVPSITIRD